MMMGGMVLGGVLLLLLLIGVPLALFGGGAALLSGAGKSDHHSRASGSAHTPQQILDQRLAEGEINTEEYRKILAELEDGGAA